MKEYLAKNGNDGVCILAGDISSVARHWVDEAKKLHDQFRKWFKNVIFVPGNHEFYGTSIREGMEVMRSWEEPGWWMLEPGLPVTINGQRFMGGTLWHDGKHERWRQKYINDYRRIMGMDEAYLHNQEFIEYTCKKMGPNDIIVSHHLPSPIVSPERFADSEINCFFVSDQTQYILERKPKLWVFGHTHDPIDKKLGDTRLYSNPRAYPNEFTNEDFWDRIRLEV